MTQKIDLIPQPVVYEPGEGVFNLNAETVIHCRSEAALPLADYLAEIMVQVLEIRLPTDSGGTVTDNAIIIQLDTGNETTAEEAYRLHVSPERITLSAPALPGLARGIQTLRQLLLLAGTGKLPCAEIRDYPRYSYRGMHLDVSRHFSPKEFILRYIDLLALYGFNTFHWHLVDDNGWRIEIKRYPLLTEVGAWRADRSGIHWTEREPRQPGEATTCGGFYTQAEIREVVAYAQQRHITIIPEIEMPGHTVAALAAYPEYSCTGGPFEVCTGSYWPNVDIFCAGKDEVFTFLENILTEVIDLFPGEYIHIGGDEADKTEWKQCARCQARIVAEGLTDEAELQSWFIRRIESFLLSHNRRLIGWDEILEGGLAPQATVMSWRGMQGGIAAATAGHDVIMTPTSHCYFDYYQGDPDYEPAAIGGYTTLKRVYTFEPTPPELDTAAASHVLGGQGNVWTEYMPTTKQVEYMLLPRMCALAEVLWSPAEQRDWGSFRPRLESHYAMFERLGLNYSRGSYRVGFQPRQVDDELSIELTSEQLEPEIHYTLDGTDPEAASPLYREPLPAAGTMEIRAALFVDGEMREKAARRRFVKHLASGKPLHYKTAYSHKYPAAGELALVDGLRAEPPYRDPVWQGFEQVNLEVDIDLGESRTLQQVSVGCLHQQRSWIFLPERVEVSVSLDGVDFSEPMVAESAIDPQQPEMVAVDFAASLPGLEARHVRVKAVNRGVCPSWHPGAGGKAWIFVDEVVVE